MRVADRTCVSIHFTIRAGNQPDSPIVDSTADREPLIYLHGRGNVMPGLENALYGHRAGDQLDVVVPPHQGFGDWQDEYVRVVPRETLAHVENLHVGLRLFAEAADGRSDLLTILEINDANIVVDGNHPLAGKTLRISVQILDVRLATEQELARGVPDTEDWK